MDPYENNTRPSQGVTNHTHSYRIINIIHYVYFIPDIYHSPYYCINNRQIEPKQRSYPQKFFVSQ